jgi:hypothetical protein
MVATSDHVVKTDTNVMAEHTRQQDALKAIHELELAELVKKYGDALTEQERVHDG